MRLFRYVIYTVIFFLALLFSRQVSLAIFHPQIQFSPIISNLHPEGTTTPSLDNQLSLVILQTTDFDQPILESAWWVALASQTPITFVNIFPSNETGNETLEDLKIHFGVRMGPNQQFELSPQFLKRLNAANIPWDGYIVLDRDTLAILVNYLGGFDYQGTTLDGSSVLMWLENAELDHDSQFDLQTNLWKSICTKSIFASSPESFELIRPALAKHAFVSPEFPLTLYEFQRIVTFTNHSDCTVLPITEDQTFVLPYYPSKNVVEK